MVGDIRQYFDTVITDCITTIERWPDDVFNNNPINEAVADKYYKMAMGQLVNDRGGLEWSDTIPVTLEIYKSLDRDKEAGFDSLYDRAIDIQRSLTDPIKIKELSTLNDVEAVSITPVEELNNDDTIKMVLLFNVRQYYTY